MEKIAAFFAGIFLSVAGLFGLHQPQRLSDLPVIPPAPIATTTTVVTNAGVVATTSQDSNTRQTTEQAAPKPSSSKGLSQSELLGMASEAFADGSVPLGDSKYVTDGPKKGYVYLCNVRKDDPGSMVNGPWMHGTSWNYLQKVSVAGSVMWSNAKFSDSYSGSWHIFSGNGLPVGYPTGVFPVASSDDAYQYDRNPNTIAAQSLSQKLPASPTYSDTPYCMGMEVGIMTDGVPLFNAFDAGLRDAPAHELQDSCDGHPQGGGEYHYHSLSNCFKDISVDTVLGYALDGYPITGPEVAPGKFLTTDDLDVCHGIISDVNMNGKTVTTYHYVMTRDFPYSASCFRGKPVSLQVIASAGPQKQAQGATQPQQGSAPQGTQGTGQPPQQAIDACSGKSQGDACSFSAPMGTISGHCDTPPGSSLACVPR